MEISLGLENAQNLAKILHFGAGKATASGKCCQDAAFDCCNNAKASLRLKKAILTRKATGKTMTKKFIYFHFKMILHYLDLILNSF